MLSTCGDSDGSCSCSRPSQRSWSRAFSPAANRLDEAFLFERSIDIDTYDRHAENLREELTLARIDRHSGHSSPCVQINQSVTISRCGCTGCRTSLRLLSYREPHSKHIQVVTGHKTAAISGTHLAHQVFLGRFGELVALVIEDREGQDELASPIHRVGGTTCDTRAAFAAIRRCFRVTSLCIDFVNQNVTTIALSDDASLGLVSPVMTIVRSAV